LLVNVGDALLDHLIGERWDDERKGEESAVRMRARFMVS